MLSVWICVSALSRGVIKGVFNTMSFWNSGSLGRPHMWIILQVANFEVAAVKGHPHLNEFALLNTPKSALPSKVFKHDISAKLILSTVVSRDDCSHVPPLISLL